MEQFCRSLPKIELHAHLNGSLSGKTLKELNCLDKDINEYHRICNIINKSEKTLKECFLVFDVAQKATSTKENVYLATKNVIEEFFEDSVIYLELRTTPRAEENMSKYDYVESVIQAIKDNKNDIIVKLLLSINRAETHEQAKESLNVIIKCKQQYPDIIRGIDLSGNPYVGTFEKILFEEARSHGLFTALHCAEIKNDEEVKNIILFRPDRIGHATFLHPQYNGCLENWNLYCKYKIPAEFCLSSNVISGTSKSYAEHHLQGWVDSSMPFSINTDDKGVFCTSLSKEYGYLAKYFNFTKQQLWNVSCSAIDQSFASETEKQLLKQKLMNWKESNAHLFV